MPVCDKSIATPAAFCRTAAAHSRRCSTPPALPAPWLLRCAMASRSSCCRTMSKAGIVCASVLRTTRPRRARAAGSSAGWLTLQACLTNRSLPRFPRRAPRQHRAPAPCRYHRRRRHNVHSRPARPAPTAPPLRSFVAEVIVSYPGSGSSGGKSSCVQGVVRDRAGSGVAAAAIAANNGNAEVGKLTNGAGEYQICGLGDSTWSILLRFVPGDPPLAQEAVATVYVNGSREQAAVVNFVERVSIDRCPAYASASRLPGYRSSSCGVRPSPPAPSPVLTHGRRGRG